MSHRLGTWGHPYGGETDDTLTLITSEPAANAVRVGHVARRGFHVRLTGSVNGVLRVEVTDTRSEHVPALPKKREPPGRDAGFGRGLLMVTAVANSWAIVPRVGRPGKTVWAEPVRRKRPPRTPEGCHHAATGGGRS